MGIVNPNVFMIPADYWTGKYTLEMEYPWLTPEAIQVLVYYVKSYHRVLEFGSGGSTLFFSNRAGNILSLETQKKWYEKVLSIGGNRHNLRLYYTPTIEDCRMRVIGEEYFDVILIDCVEVSRVDAAMMSIDLIKKDGIIVVDNYGADYCNGIDELFKGKSKTTFDDSHWAGCGTRIYYC